MIKQLFIMISVYAAMSVTTVFAQNLTEKEIKLQISTQQVLRFIDTKEEYGKSCEAYSYITPQQRLKLLKHNDFMLGDILSESFSLSIVNPEYLVDTNLTECNEQGMKTSEYIYRENLEYLGENVITIGVFQYVYGAGAAHGNGHMSHYIYDREYGMEIDWNNLFGDSEEFDLYVLKRVVKEIADEDFISYFKVREPLLNFRKPGYFAITDEGLLIQYGKYEITPGASGLPSLTIPKEVLKQYMTKEMYGKCFLTQKQMILEVLNEF